MSNPTSPKPETLDDIAHEAFTDARGSDELGPGPLEPGLMLVGNLFKSQAE